VGVLLLQSDQMQHLLHDCRGLANVSKITIVERNKLLCRVTCVRGGGKGSWIDTCLVICHLCTLFQDTSARLQHHHISTRYSMHHGAARPQNALYMAPPPPSHTPSLGEWQEVHSFANFSRGNTTVDSQHGLCL